MDMAKHRFITEARKRTSSLSANEVGGEGRGEVARETQIPSPCPSPRLGGARETEHIPGIVFIRVHGCPFVVDFFP